MKKRKALVLEVTLGVIALLTMLGGITTYMIQKESQGTGSTKYSVEALKIAESGVERVLADIKSGNLKPTTSPQTATATFANGTYIVTVVKNPDGTIKVDSVGKIKDISREVKVIIKIEGGPFFPFSINGTFDITGMDSTPWTEAEMGVVNISSTAENLLTNANFTVHKFSSLEPPKAADMDTSTIFAPLDNETCDIGNPSSDVYLSSLSNIEGKTICGKNIFIDTSIDVDNVKLLAENDIYVKDELGDKGMKTDWNVTIAAKDKVIFDDKIKFTGKTKGGYNLLVYAGNEIDANTFPQGVITVTGNQDATKTSSIFFITPGAINVDSSFLWDTGSTKQGANFVIWADKGVNINDSKSIHLTGSCPDGYERNFAFIVADGDVHMKDLDFKKNTHPSGLTYEEIKNYCLNGTSLGIPLFYKNFYCELKKQIDNAGTGGKIIIKEWKVY
ncbi:hypothetical protein [Desulfurobacterium indicum]|uniref:Type 4 fimbrial biogenesis protein PilX N-terminal domain-containing protein n=1 Tax=Desulfurobacterium indicum TaxID=1914305 RepID=A0A1R1MNE6_9BACT|nr:hypothetical protein [Desulfurobacterium indicum]OMH41338.1 hypothetical protein BLW93_00170 [Desulfurobacterium indicum]